MPRRPLLLLIVLGLLSASVSWAQTASSHSDTDPATSAAIQAVLNAQAAAWNRGDVKAYMEAGYLNSPDLLFIGKDVRKGYAPVLAHYLERYPDTAHMGQLKFSQLDIRPLGADHAWVLGQWHLQRATGAGGDVGGWFTLLFLKTGKGWRIVADHTS